MSEHSAKGLSRFAMEIGVALSTGAFGAAVCYGSIEAGTGWTDMGPDAGYFPFYIGLLIMFGSAANLITALVKHRGSGEIFFEAAGSRSYCHFCCRLWPLPRFLPFSVFTSERRSISPAP
jgi:hypothetical protein